MMLLSHSSMVEHVQLNDDGLYEQRCGLVFKVFYLVMFGFLIGNWYVNISDIFS